MPYAEDFDAAAVALDEAAQEIATLMAPIRSAMGDTVMIGGQLTGLVTDELDTADGLVEHVVTELNQLAGQCRERAETCRQALAAQGQYDQDFAAYQAAVHQDGGTAGGLLPPVPPPAAPPWANH